jgi:serine/threonine-protein kinase/endoribonuclease IRE1
MVEETGSLFAMSPDHYPLVVFGGPERYNQGRLLDAPGRQLEDRDDGDDDEGEDGRVPTAVDEITRLRKQRQRMDERKREACVGDSYSRLRDRRCLVGVRRLEDGDGHESRMRRLLDGPVRGEVGPEVPSNESTPVDEEEVLEDPGLGMVTGAKEARKFWEVVIVSVVVGILSVWFVVRRIKRKSLMVLVEEEERKRAEEDVMTPTPSTAGIPMTPLTAGPVDVQEPVQSPITNGFKDSPKSKDSAQSLPPIADDGDESGGDGEDPVATPGKRKGRRGKRGKKKKAGAIAGSGGGGAEEAEEEKKLNGAAHVNGLAVVKEVETPSPPQTSLVITSSPKPAPTGPSLIVSDTILGTSMSLRYSGRFINFSSRLWLTRHSSIPRLPPRPRSSRQTPPPRLCHPRLKRSEHPPRKRRPPKRHPILLPRSPRQLPLHRLGALPRLAGRHNRVPRPRPVPRHRYFV